MQARVLLRDPDRHLHELVPGDIIGRVWSAALQLDDGRVSEAHAMVSLRDGQLHLISLRGALSVDDQVKAQVALVAGGRVTLARGVWVDVVSVHLPTEVLGVEGEGVPRQILPGVGTFLTHPSLRLVKGWREEGRLHVWSTSDRWMCREGDTSRPLAAGDTARIDGRWLRFLAIPVTEASAPETERRDKPDEPIRLVANYDTVHLHRDVGPPVVLAGLQARLVSELVACNGPLSWEGLTLALWPHEEDPFLRRGRLDTLLSRIRRRLRAAGIRTDLVRADRAGQLELLLYGHDRVEDRT